MVELRLTEEQAKITSLACEFYARVRMGQFRELIWNQFMIRDMGDKDYFARRDEAERLLMEARAQVYPDLGKMIGASYGMGKFDDADAAFDVHQVLRHVLGDKREPFSYHELPECRKVEDKK